MGKLYDFILYTNEAGESEVRSEKAINKYQLRGVKLDNYDVDDVGYVVLLKEEYPKNYKGVRVEIWHCFKIVKCSIKGYWLCQQLKYTKSIIRDYQTYDEIKTYDLNKEEIK